MHENKQNLLVKTGSAFVLCVT